MERSGRGARGVGWSHTETQALLAVWSEDRIRRELEVSFRNRDVYGEMSARLAAVGVSRSAKQCRAKLKKLKHEYRQFKEQFISGETPLTSETFEWYHAMDSVIRDRPAAATTDNTGQRVLELMISDVKTDSPSVTNIPETFSTSSSSSSMENLQEPVFNPIKLEDSVAPLLTPPPGQTSAMWSPSPVRRRKSRLQIERPMCSWSTKEVLVLLEHWANPGVQQELRRNVRNNAVYTSLSAKLATLGFSKTAQKCKEKLKKLKQDYKRIKNSKHLDGGKNMWFNIIDQVLGSQPAASEGTETATPSSAEPTHSVGLDAETPSFVARIFETCTVPSPSPCPAEIPKEPDIHLVDLGDSDTPATGSSASPSAAPTSDTWSTRRVGKKRYVHMCSWSKKEVHILLAFWANPGVQQELRRNVRNNAVYNGLSAKLASFGFYKSPQKCKEKIKKLKQDYRKIRKSQHRSWRRTAWFGILDEVLGSQPAALKCSATPKPSSAEPAQPVGLDLETHLSTDGTEWLPDEVQVLVTLWAQPNIQKQLLTSATHNDVFTYLSNELALIGFNKTPQQCSVKVITLKETYKNIKQVEPHGNDGSDWFDIMDAVLRPDAQTSRDVTSAAAPIAPESPEDSSRAAWTSDEAVALLTLWAEESVQARLRWTGEDERVYAQLSSELATQGFDKSTNQCRTKIRLLEQEYERIQEEKDSQAQKSSWFAIMDQIRECPKPKTETELAGTEGCRLSIPSLSLLVPTLRLMCAFAWQVVRCCNVEHYKKVEELVLLATELAPELLTARERVQLLLRLRARLVLELCRSESAADPLTVQPHLRIIQDLTMSSGSDQEELEELEESKSNFVEVVRTLLDNPEERKRFFMKVFPIHYGQQYEATLQSLVWKFISRLDNLLPVPDIKQTAEWLSSAPSVMEECGQLVLEREQLKALLHFHEQQTGNTNACFSQAQNLFLPPLYLQPKTNSRQHEASAGENNGWVNCGREPVETSLANDVLTAEDSGKGDNLKNNHSSNQLHRCSTCSYSDSRVAALLQHIRQEHRVQESSPFPEPQDNLLLNVDSPFAGTLDCEFSSDILKDLVTPDSHGPPFQCDRCEKKYLSKSSLTVHHRIHTGETPFLCSICGQGFRCSSYLELHTRTHTGERRFKCHICGKTSVQPLTRHMRMHRGEKNYPCTECGKAFLSSGELRLHLRSHSGERPYTCKQCGKGFTAKCLLTVHTRRHTGECPYRCSLCPKAFPTLRAQKKHTKIHTDKKSYQCLKCGKIFRQEVTFNFHIKTHDLI